MLAHENVGQVRNGARRPEPIVKGKAAKPDPQASSRKQAAPGTAGASASMRRKGPRYGCGF